LGEEGTYAPLLIMRSFFQVKGQIEVGKKKKFVTIAISKKLTMKNGGGGNKSTNPHWGGGGYWGKEVGFRCGIKMGGLIFNNKR